MRGRSVGRPTPIATSQTATPPKLNAHEACMHITQVIKRNALVPEEGRAERAEFVDEAAEGPDVGSVVVGPTGPNLGRHVVRRADLGLLVLGVVRGGERLTW